MMQNPSPAAGRRDYIMVAGLFAVSRALYALLGVQFDATTLPGYMQFIDVTLLRERLLESLWYYHAHPPLLNLFAGIGLKLGGDNADVWFALAFHALGLAMALAVYILTLRLSGARSAAIVATGLLVFSPSFVLYENWLMYSFPAAAMLTVSALLLHQYLATRRTRWAAAFFTMLAILLLTRSIFHLAWMLLVAMLLAIVLRQWWRQVLLAAAAPLFVVALWYGKNYYYFGTFGASTTAGLGLANITTLMVERRDLYPLLQDGRLSRYATLSRYDFPELLFVPDTPVHTGIPVLDQVKKSDDLHYNYNNLQMVAVNRHYISDGIEVIHTFPASYAVGLVMSNLLFFSPTDMNVYFTTENRAAALPMDRIFNPFMYGLGAKAGFTPQPHFGFNVHNRMEVHTSVLLIAQWFVLLAYGYVQARRGVVAANPDTQPRALVLGFIVLTALYLYVVSTTIELGENYRYRFSIEPLFLVLMVTAITDLVRRIRARVAKSA
jgi:4-amino-4-deoxy-L-arabinose transferase and related glycosyltransferases of PMT family